MHAVPVQSSRAFLQSIKEILPKDIPVICVSKGLEVCGCMCVSGEGGSCTHLQSTKEILPKDVPVICVCKGLEVCGCCECVWAVTLTHKGNGSILARLHLRSLVCVCECAHTHTPPPPPQVGSGQMMSEVIPSALERKQPAVFISGPSFAKEVMENRPTGALFCCVWGGRGGGV